MSNCLLKVSTWCVIDIWSLTQLNLNFWFSSSPTPDPPTDSVSLLTQWKQWGLPWLFSFSLSLASHTGQSVVLCPDVIPVTMTNDLSHRHLLPDCSRLLIDLAFLLIFSSWFSIQARAIFPKYRSYHCSVKTLQQHPIALRLSPELPASNMIWPPVISHLLSPVTSSAILALIPSSYTLASLLFPGHISHAPILEPLHWLSPLCRLLFPQKATWLTPSPLVIVWFVAVSWSIPNLSSIKGQNNSHSFCGSGFQVSHDWVPVPQAFTAVRMSGGQRSLQ